MTRYKLGDRVEITMGADTRKQGNVIRPFDWREEPGAYQTPKKTQVPIKLDNGEKKWMHKVHIKKVKR